MDLGYLFAAVALLIVAAVVHREGDFPYARWVVIACVVIALLCLLALGIDLLEGADDDVGDGDYDAALVTPLFVAGSVWRSFRDRLRR